MTQAIPSLLLAALAGAVVAALILFAVIKRRTRAAFEAGEQRQTERAAAERQLLEERLDARMREGIRLERAVHVATQSLTQSGDENRRLLAENAALSARLEETARAFAEKEQQFTATGVSLKREFELLANRIFEEQGQSFARNNRAQLDALLSPFREQITEFKQRVEHVYHTDSKDRASLLTEVRNLHRASDKINQEAENLAKALKGDKRLQGNWGELVLERVLHESGLRKDHEYTVQATHRTEGGDARRPDVIIHLPDDKDIIVDSKVSLVAYERAVAANESVLREGFLRQHVSDLRAQVKRLAEQEYDRLPGVRSLDFVLLFVPIESAFMLAMEHDDRLFTEAFSKRIVIVSPTTLLMTLRIIHNVWRYEKQTRNAQEIARRAGALYDKLRLVMEDMVKLGGSLRSAEDSYQTAMQKLASGKGNLVAHVEHFRELGASVRRPFPKELLESADGASDVDEPQISESEISVDLVPPLIEPGDAADANDAGS